MKDSLLLYQDQPEQLLGSCKTGPVAWYEYGHMDHAWSPSDKSAAHMTACLCGYSFMRLCTSFLPFHGTLHTRHSLQLTVNHEIV